MRRYKFSALRSSGTTTGIWGELIFIQYHPFTRRSKRWTACVGVMFAPVTCFVTFVLLGRRLSGNVLLEEFLQCVRRILDLQALFLLRRRLPHERKLLREFCFLGLLLLLLPSP